MQFSDIISFYGLGLEPMVVYIFAITSHQKQFLSSISGKQG